MKKVCMGNNKWNKVEKGVQVHDDDSGEAVDTSGR
jgi:hypothetical protein